MGIGQAHPAPDGATAGVGREAGRGAISLWGGVIFETALEPMRRKNPPV